MNIKKIAAVFLSIGTLLTIIPSLPASAADSVLDDAELNNYITEYDRNKYHSLFPTEAPNECINKKSPSPSKEHINFLPDEGDHIHFSMLIVTPDLKRNSRKNSQTLTLVAIIGKSGSGKTTLLNIIGCIDSFEQPVYFVANYCMLLLADSVRFIIPFTPPFYLTVCVGSLLSVATFGCIFSIVIHFGKIAFTQFIFQTR